MLQPTRDARQTAETFVSNKIGVPIDRNELRHSLTLAIDRVGMDSIATAGLPCVLAHVG